MTVSAIVLAAGEGTRMRSAAPKPLHLICGRPMVMHVIHALSDIYVDRTVVVVGHGAERVTKKVQEQAPGWAHVDLRRADRAARHRRRRDGRDDGVPRRRPRRRPRPSSSCPATRRCCAPRRSHELVATHLSQRQRGDGDHAVARGSDRLRASVRAPSKHGDGRVLRVVEQRDATPEELGDPRGVTRACTRSGATCSARRCARLSPDNSQGEYYLTDVDRGAGRHGPPGRHDRRRPRPRRPAASTTAGSWRSPSASCAAAPTVTGCSTA